MFRPSPPTRLLVAALAAAPVVGARAEIQFGNLPPLRWGAEVAVGAEYDSNVSVEEVDRASNASDIALTIDAGGEVEQSLGERAEIGLTYDFSQSLYREFSQVDRQTHILGGDLRWAFDAADADVSAYYIHSRLDRKKFLELYRVSPAISGFLAKQWFARTAYVYQDKTIEERPLRDAITHSGEVDLYYFARGLRSYVNMGYRYKDEDANAAQLDYKSHSVKLRFIQRIEFASRLTKLELSWRYEDRDYTSETPSIGERRRDKRHRLRADFEIPVLERAAVLFYYAYGDYNSNLERVDYTQNIAGARFIFRW